MGTLGNLYVQPVQPVEDRLHQVEQTLAAADLLVDKSVLRTDNPE